MDSNIAFCLIGFAAGLIIGLITGGVIFYRRIKSEDLISSIKTELSNAANEVIIEKQKILQQNNQKELEIFLAPLKEKIKEFQIRVEEANETGKINTATIKEKIEDLIKQNQLTCTSTEKLAEAISQNSKSRGILGEMILDKLLKSSGLIDKKDNPEKGNFETQKSVITKTGKKGIADVIIYLAEGTKSIIIDSKAPLSKFLEFYNTKNENSLAEFLNDVKDRIKELSGKYSDLEGLNTPDFTIMFIPFEQPLSYIYSNNKLIEEAMRANIIIAGPSTLITALRIINYAWVNKNQSENIQNITKLADNIYSKCIVLIQKFEDVKTAFETLKGRFENVFTTIKGQGGLIGQVEKLKEYGAAPAKNIEAKYLEDTETPANF